MTPLWIDTDMGFDDMLAIMMVQRTGRAVAGCSLVFGNTTLDQVQINAAGMAALWSWDFPIHRGCAAPIAGTLTTAEGILGHTGLPTLGQSLPIAPPLADRSSALDGLVKWLENARVPVEILALGPLTNVGTLFNTRPDLLNGIACVTWMGGGATTGNHTATAEFNSFADPEAAAIVCGSGVRLKMLDLDVCRQVTMAPSDLNALRTLNTDKALLLHDLLGGFINISVSKGRPSQPMFDPVAAACLIDQSAVAFDTVDIRVDTSDSFTRGRTVVSNHSGGGNLQIGTVADADLIRKMALDTMVEAALA